MNALNTLKVLEIFLLGVAIAAAMTPISIIVAKKIGAMDVPKDQRRMHEKAIPRFGGLAIFVATMVTLGVFDWGNEKIRIAMLGGALMYILGVVDDLIDIKASVKFICQVGIAVLMYALGMRIGFIADYFGGGDHIYFGTAVGFIFTMIWIVGITNTINLIDGLDGLAAGVTAIAAISIAYVAYIHGDTKGMTAVCIAMVAIAGACVGFLPFNFYPAKTFMGDSGALFLGFMLAILSVVGPLKRSTVVAVAVPVVTLAIPIFDTTFAMIRRMLNGQSIMAADKGHLHHRLMESGYGQRRAVIMLYGISAVMGMAAVLVSRELYKDAIWLAAAAAAYLYVFLTDPTHKATKIRGTKIEEEEEGKTPGEAPEETMGEDTADNSVPGDSPKE